MVGFDHACNLEDELASGGGVGCRFLSLSEYEKLKDQVWAKQKLKKLTAESVFKAEKKKDRAEQVKQLTVESAKRESENTALRAQNEKVGEALQKKEELLKELTVAFEDQVKHTVEMEGPYLSLPQLTLPCLTLPHLTSPHLASPRLASPRLSLPHRT